jgi:photosystem II stability/assembly factor-like uncharacterized protein
MNNKILLISIGIVGAICGYLLNHSFKNTNFPKEHNELILEENEDQVMTGLIYMNRLRVNQNTGKIDAQDIYNAVSQADMLSAKNKTNAASLWWAEMGPDNVGGRTRAFLIDKDDHNVLYAGSVGGGLWKSTTAGTSWKKVTPGNIDNFPVVSIAQTSDGAIFIGTGETDFVFLEGTNTGSGFIGTGIWKSTDAGSTWVKLASANPNVHPRWQNVNSLATNKEGTRIYAATSGGLLYSDDGGTTWINCNVSTSTVLEVKVGSSGVVLASTPSRVWISSTGAPGSFVQKQLSPNPINRISLAIADSDPNYMYAMASSGVNNQLEGVYRSTDGGTSWSRIGANSTELNILASQGTYDNVVAVDPENKDHIFAGGLGNWDWAYGKGWKQISSLAEFFSDRSYNRTYVHADMHGYIFDKTTTPVTMYLVNDGGVYRTKNKGATYEKLNFNYSVTQLYSVAANRRGEIIFGTQDNGTYLIDFKRNVQVGDSSKSAIETLGGDGFYSEFSRINPDICYGANPGNFYRSLNRGQSWSTYFDGNIGANGEKLGVSFLTPFKLWESVLDLTLPDSIQEGMMFYGGSSGAVWMTPDAIDFSKNPTFYKIAQVAASGQIFSMDFTPSGNTLFVGTITGQIYRISGIRGTTYNPDSATGWDGALHGITVTQLNSTTSQAITSISVHPVDTNLVVFTAGNYGNNNYVYKSTNAMATNGVTFSSIQGSLPRMPVYSSVINIDDPNHIIIGSELGVWASKNGGTTWSEENNGLSRTPCYMLRQYEWRSWEGPTIFAATHGRGVFATKSLLTPSFLTSTKNILGKSTANIYPNPAKENVNIEFTLNKTAAVTISILNMSGNNVLSKKIVDVKKGLNKVNIEIGAILPGNYFVRVESESETSTGKLIIVR